MAKDLPLSFLGGLTAETFLAEYWQKKPLFVKNAFPNFEDPISADEIAGLAFESFIPSRFIYESGGERPWQLKMGPATDEDFASLKDKKWMLVVNDVEKNLPQLKGMLTPFDFIAHWRLDDLQVSLGEDEGTVGAHWDDYDVFLIQGMGQKKWQISYSPVSEDDFMKGVDIRLIEDFKVDEEWIVEPGDMLYLPPRIGHYGVNIGRSVTWSVGFRAPKHQELFRDFIEMKFDAMAEDARYSDPDMQYAHSKGELSDDALDRVVAIVEAGLKTNRDEIAKWFAEFMTEPKMFQAPDLLEESVSPAQLYEFLDEGGALEIHPGLSLIHRQIGEQYMLFAGGKSYSLPLEDRSLILLLMDAEFLEYDDLADYLENNRALEFLATLLNEGVLMMEEEA